MTACKQCPSSWSCFTRPICLPAKSIVFNHLEAPQNFYCQVCQHSRDHKVAMFEKFEVEQYRNAQPVWSMGSSAPVFVNSQPAGWCASLYNVRVPSFGVLDGQNLMEELREHPFVICHNDCYYLLQDFCVSSMEGCVPLGGACDITAMTLIGSHWSGMERMEY